jgi:hypothetical protein
LSKKHEPLPLLGDVLDLEALPRYQLDAKPSAKTSGAAARSSLSRVEEESLRNRAGCRDLLV